MLQGLFEDEEMLDSRITNDCGHGGPHWPPCNSGGCQGGENNTIATETCLATSLLAPLGPGPAWAGHT